MNAINFVHLASLENLQHLKYLSIGVEQGQTCLTFKGVMLYIEKFSSLTILWFDGIVMTDDEIKSMNKKYQLNTMKNILFVCSQNKLRSPTGEALFCSYPDLDVRSAGLNNNAEIPLGIEDVEWADIIFVMEQKHKKKLSSKFKASLKEQKLICLNIPDNYEYMDPALIKELNKKVPQYL